VIILYGCSAGIGAIAIEPVILIVSPVKVLGANPYNVYGTSLQLSLSYMELTTYNSF